MQREVIDMQQPGAAGPGGPALAAFIVNLMQDVNILRPLVLMAARELGLETRILLTAAFVKRDAAGTWQREIEELVAASGAMATVLADDLAAQQALAGRRGILVAGSESSLEAHRHVHDIFRLAPPSLLKVTLQHGFECVGFLQSFEQNLAHGRTVTFGADVICGWCEPERLTAVLPSQRSKLLVTGPTAVLQPPPSGGAPLGMGLVCENMHSPRLRVTGDFKQDFLSVFGAFCDALAAEGQQVVLRPHPGGQYTLKNDVPLPANVTLNNSPIYKVDLSRHAYGISAPSSILVDMVLAGIPTAVWQDAGSKLDLGNYEGLARISTLEDWIEFSREARARPEKFLRMQERFLARQKMVTDRRVVHARYAALLQAATQPAVPASAAAQERILFVANNMVPTLQLSFIKPLLPLEESGQVVMDFVTEEGLKLLFGAKLRDERIDGWLRQRLVAFAPTMIVFCRYSGTTGADVVMDYARRARVPTIYHIDDDLLHIPQDIGEKKHRYHNQPDRLATVRLLMDEVDLVYCSTRKLEARLHALGVKAPVRAGTIYCAGTIIAPAEPRPVVKVGYMASADHAHNLTMVLPALVRFMRRNPQVQFEFFGSIPTPDAFREFGDRVTQAPKIDNYEEFLQRFAEYRWDIGICPLVPIHFNLMKANTKWVEYTSVGAAVVAQKGTVYDECCAGGCGELAETEDEWLAALERLACDAQVRFAQVQRAQARLANDYSVARLREQVKDMFDTARVNSMQSNSVEVIA